MRDLSFEPVLEAAVVARQDPYWGEIPVAFVTRSPGPAATEAELIEHARARLAHFKAPRPWCSPSSPKASTGKVPKDVLRRRAVTAAGMASLPSVDPRPSNDGPEGAIVRIEVLTVPGCPNGPVLTQRLATVLGDGPEVPVVQRSATDPEEAARRGMHGSPTLLINGRDPFADPDTPTSLSCRLCWAPDGSRQDAPSVEDLRRVLHDADRGRSQ